MQTPVQRETEASAVLRNALSTYTDQQVEASREDLLRSGYYRSALLARRRMQAKQKEAWWTRVLCAVLVAALLVAALLVGSIFARDDGKMEVDLGVAIGALRNHPKALELHDSMANLSAIPYRTFGALRATGSDPRALVHLSRGLYRGHDGELRSIKDNSRARSGYTRKIGKGELVDIGFIASPPVPGWTPPAKAPAIPSPPPLPPPAFIPKHWKEVAHCGGKEGCFRTKPYACPDWFERRCVPGRDDSVDSQIKRLKCVPLNVRYAPMYIGMMQPNERGGKELMQYTGKVDEACLLLHWQDIYCKLTLQHCLYDAKTLQGLRGIGDITPIKYYGATSCGARYNTDTWTREECCGSYRESMCIVDEVLHRTADSLSVANMKAAEMLAALKKVNQSTYDEASKNVDFQSMIEPTTSELERLTKLVDDSERASASMKEATQNPMHAWGAGRAAPAGKGIYEARLIPMDRIQLQAIATMKNKCGCNEEDRFKIVRTAEDGVTEVMEDVKAHVLPGILADQKGHDPGGVQEQRASSFDWRNALHQPRGRRRRD